MSIKKRFVPLVILSSLAWWSCSDNQPRILVFSKTAGYRHASIQEGKRALMALGQAHGFGVDTTENANAFQEYNLKKYKAVVFLSTTGDVLTHSQQADMERFIQAGGGFVGIHAAADTEYGWPWYGQLVGGYFKSHPHQQQATARRVKAFGQAQLPDAWQRFDEWYNYRNLAPDLNILYNLDETTYQGGENGSNHPIAWYHDYDGGRAFYTGMGHTTESFADEAFLAHLLDGIRYAMGEGRLDYQKAKSGRVPEADRFTKQVLGYYFDEPTEMTILPDGRILFLERKGNVKLYDPAADSIRIINRFDVYNTFEDGMIGLTHDPDFANNAYLYIFYSHPTRSANILSRFVFDGNKIDRSSEKELLEVPVQRETCCHTGGSLAFGPGGNLFISTGDNTSPFESNGYSPSDERKGRAPFDAQKSSSNTNDLRGKILRIHPEPDGTYTIPEGNLFAKGEPNTRPEIYVMGTRNPYRISVDPRTGFLYWGEVGPDAGEPDSLRGPRGYDEVNQAQQAGFFGWPYFVGNNFAYGEHDFQTGKTGARHDPAKPINNSPNNTGKRELPPAQPAMVYYPYARSPEFPLVREGGRNAMAGPVYYSENFKGIPTAFPSYLDSKPIIYDWMRNWLMLVTLNDQGQYVSMEPFLEGMPFNNLIDMAFGPDGQLYTLEYGTAWFKQNRDARLSRIEYNAGNRKPQARLSVNRSKGSVPLTVRFTAQGTYDPEGDPLSYQLSDGKQSYTSPDGTFSVTFDKPGIYRPVLTVKDSQGNPAEAYTEIWAGNEPPTIDLAVEWEGEEILPNTPVPYRVSVNDVEDAGKIADGEVIITFDYLAEGYDLTQIAQGHQRPELPGKALIAQSDCKSCHLTDTRSAGPSYRDIAQRYKNKPDALNLLAGKIIKGGAGVWGEVPMAAHPQIKQEEALQMVEYILSLGTQKEVKRLPREGVVKTGSASKGIYILTASYEDKGALGLPSLQASKTRIFKVKSPNP
ncbi:MAG: ThuA domain-containing protein [Cyclobacteriaceae bacterium]|jgi:cytochrome c|nr:ThuA domain-containing protein [Cyclobacteriaceae bacterium]